MATENQKQFISDIESAISAIKMKNPDHVPEGLTITEVCELAGRSSIEMRAMVLRIAAKPADAHLLHRLHNAFTSVNLSPSYLAQSVADSTQNQHAKQELQNVASKPLKFSAPQATGQTISNHSMPQIVTRTQTKEMPLPARSEVAPGEVMNQVIKILDPLPEKQQRRVIVSVSAYYGIGE